MAVASLLLWGGGVGWRDVLSFACRMRLVVHTHARVHPNRKTLTCPSIPHPPYHRSPTPAPRVRRSTGRVKVPPCWGRWGRRSRRPCFIPSRFVCGVCCRLVLQLRLVGPRWLLYDGVLLSPCVDNHIDPSLAASSSSGYHTARTTPTNMHTPTNKNNI